MLIEFDHVTVALQERAVLQDVTLRLAEARIGVIGANGSGKSTFARLLNGLVQPASGRLRVDGLDPVREARAVRRRVGFVFQNPDHQIVFPVVGEDVGFGLRNLGVPAAEVAPRIAATLGSLGIGHLAERPSHALSGGEKQLAALAAVLVMEPALVVFDEPTTLLDLRNRNRFAAILAGLAQQALVVTHDLELLAGFDRVLVIDAGRVACDAAPAEAIAWYRRHSA